VFHPWLRKILLLIAVRKNLRVSAVKIHLHSAAKPPSPQLSKIISSPLKISPLFHSSKIPRQHCPKPTFLLSKIENKKIVSILP
jgi:hypothetical protein